MSGFAVLVYKAHPRLLIFPAVKKSAPYTRDYTVDKISLQKGLTVCEKRAVKQVQQHA